MNISQYRAFINAELDKVEAEHGNLPVVMWYHNKMLSEYLPSQTLVSEEQYTGEDDKKWKERHGKVLILGA